MKRTREDSEDDPKGLKDEIQSMRELLTRVIENSEISHKRTKSSLKTIEDDNDNEEQRPSGFLSSILSIFEGPPKTTESIITDLWGNKILNGEVVTTKIPYADAGTLIEYTFFISYPNFIDDNHVINLCSSIPDFYRLMIDLKDCVAGNMRVVVRKCEAQRLKRLLNREQLKEPVDSHRSTILGIEESNIKDESLREMGQRLGKILSISDHQSPDLPTASERTIKGSVIGVTHRNINPPISNTDITQIMGIPLVHALRIQPEKSRPAIRLTLEIQKG
jgi:hypothetical protein